ncbi:inactive tyrosine-protein kinase 7 [Dunckerocampus dactyliophorus]|uniref:inactive tyrosine-protein kinase 7 n=1 Tax=Dunckerocampus dactyliophorus TaxID=161453 RepID=UPI0024064DF1|nr:inactive tyrosine-protein kinase 7 [Dunckerocampus dactyliophorus]XP_054654599.1 inactive tyrosine-protein kinase 7 [Dunckerocampus dactyliophorus]XP_054654600.1 inactive tyrosine-protein kinase 7 [Dunckerocampus dactyliophorus]
MDLTREAEDRRGESGRKVRLSPMYALAIISLQVLSIQAAAIQFTKEPKSQDALHGRSAMLRCEVSDPTDITYSWLHNGHPLENSERRYQEGSNLKFTAVDRQMDAGNFECVVENTATGEALHSTNASFNIKWLESGGVTLKEPTSEGEIESSAPVTLRCHIDGHPRPTCQWFKDGVKLTEKSHQINNKERTLTFKSATPDDNGLFYCCAKNAAGHVCSNSNFTLNIIDKSFPRPVVTPEDQVVLRNEEAVFHCQFTAVPPPTLEWYHENELLVNKSRVFLLSNGSLLITQVKPRNTGLYKCVGHGVSGSQVTHEASLLIAEIDDMLSKMSKVFTADTLQRVPCNPPRGRPQPMVWWERGGQRVPAEGRVYQDGLDLVFSPTEAGDSGVYTCVAQNKAGRRTQEVTFTVATAPVWVTRPQDSHLEEGKPGYLHCHAKATPEPEVTWLRNNIMITPEDSRFKLFPNGTLRINSVEVYDGQMYGCETKTVGGRLSGQARVAVLEKLKFTPTPQPSQCLELDNEINIQCSAKGRESPTIRWTKADGGDLPPHVEQKNGQLHFSKVTRSDAGNYTCIASNSLQGEIRAFVSLTVAVYIRFKVEPENTTVYQGHTAILHCQATGSPEPHIHWMVKDKTLDISRNRRIQKMPNGSLVISDVTTDDTGRYTCVAGNSCSIKDRVAQLYVVDKPAQTHDEDEDRAPYKMIQTIGLSVGAAVAYIIVVLGLMFYCKKRRNAKRLHKRQDGEEPEMECLNGGAVQQNGHTTTEIQEEVALTNMGTMATTEKRHSHVNSDKLHFPRANLQTITTLGKGEFGEVLLSKAKGIEEREEETVVLVKSLQTRDEQLQLDFRREAEMFAKLSHPNVVRLLGLCREAEPHYVVLEYYDLGDLKQFLRISKNKDDKVKSQPISTKTKVSICAQVARGMEHLSNHRFVHKDLAARNCLVSSQRRVKVSSLSLSKDVYKSEYYHYRQAWIPLRWLPSESVFEDDFSTKSDVWAFGVLMWEVFSHGEMPYTKLGDNEVLEGLQTGKLKLPPPEGCPSKMYKLMVSCWAPSLKERPSFSDVVRTLGETPSDSKV